MEWSGMNGWFKSEWVDSLDRNTHPAKENGVNTTAEMDNLKRALTISPIVCIS